MSEGISDAAALRRPPPPLRPARVVGTAPLTPRLLSVVLDGLPGMRVDEPAASVRLLLPEPQGLVLPAWNGNEFLLPDGRRPGLRTLTPVAADPDAGTLEVAVVLRGASRLTDWAEAARPGDAVAVSGPGRGYRFDPEAHHLLLLGDESALPAIRQLLGALPPGTHAHVIVEIATPEARLDLPGPAPVEWIEGNDVPGDALVGALTAAELPAAVHVWAAGEAAAVQRIRRHLFGDRGLDRARCSVRGYWKRGRSGT
jgi:NADPH-dependent ferric siderophore reductase